MGCSVSPEGLDKERAGPLLQGKTFLSPTDPAARGSWSSRQDREEEGWGKAAVGEQEGKGTSCRILTCPRARAGIQCPPWVNLVANPKTQQRPLEAMSAKPTADPLGGTAGRTPTQRSKPQLQLAGGQSVRFSWQRPPRSPKAPFSSGRRRDAPSVMPEHAGTLSSAMRPACPRPSGPKTQTAFFFTYLFLKLW